MGTLLENLEKMQQIEAELSVCDICKVTHPTDIPIDLINGESVCGYCQIFLEEKGNFYDNEKGYE